MNEGCKTLPISRFQKEMTASTDVVVVEEPLEIRVGKESLSVTMRTPGHDLDLVTGFLFTEGVISKLEVPKMKKAGKNTIEIAPQKTKNTRNLKSRFFTSSSCGLCGRTTVAQIRRRLGSVKTDFQFSAQVLSSLPDLMRQHQENFGATGGLHGAALFNPRGQLIVVREDVGRHNAVDKAIGSFIRHGIRDSMAGLLVSGRASFEIVQKALAAQIPFVVAVSAPSTLAVELAREAGITLIAFLRGETFNVYSRADRIKA
jgi:FdhD protein